MLKKAGIAVAVAAAGVLALAPFAFADDEDQTNTQTSTQGEGEANGYNKASGYAEGLCHLAIIDGHLYGPGECPNTSVQEDQVEKQHQWEH